MTIQLEAKPLFDLEAFREFCDRPENSDRAFELDEGRIIEMPSPSELHGFVVIAITSLLLAYKRKIGRGRIIGNDSGLLLQASPPIVRGPDLAFFKESKSHSELSRGTNPDCPEVVVEVLSPSNSTREMNRKIIQYLRRGIPFVWVVDPEDKSMMVYRPNQNPEILEGDQTIESPLAPEGFVAKISQFFEDQA
jgi:Uma2 family endonuclease